MRWWMGHKWMTFLWGEKPSSLQGAFHVMLIRQELSGEQLLIEVIKIFCFSTEPAISELRVIKSRLLSFKREEFVWKHKYCPQLDPQLISKVFTYTDKPLFCHHLVGPGDQELLCVINSFYFLAAQASSIGDLVTHSLRSALCWNVVRVFGHCPFGGE